MRRGLSEGTGRGSEGTTHLAHTAFAAWCFPLVIAVYPPIGVCVRFFIRALVLVVRHNALRVRVILVPNGVDTACTSRVSEFSCSLHETAPRGRTLFFGCRKRALDTTRTCGALPMNEDPPLGLLPAPSRSALDAAALAVGEEHRSFFREGKGIWGGDGVLCGGAPGGALAGEKGGGPIEAHPPALVLVECEEETEGGAGFGVGIWGGGRKGGGDCMREEGLAREDGVGVVHRPADPGTAPNGGTGEGEPGCAP